MFNWLKSSTSNKVRLSESGNHVFFPVKRKENSTSSPSSSSSLSSPSSSSSNLELDDSFSTTRDSAFSDKGRQLSSRFISMFKKKSKDGLMLSSDKRKNRSTSSLLDDSPDEGTNREKKTRFLDDAETTKKSKRRRGDEETVESLLSTQRKRKLFKRRSLDDYAKRSLQISRDSGWEGASSSSSLSSLLDQTITFAASSPIAKNDLKKKHPRLALKKAAHSRAVMRKKMALCVAAAARARSSMDVCKSEEEASERVDDKSSDSCGTKNNSDLFISDQSIADLLDKLRALKIARSLDCIARLSTSSKRRVFNLSSFEIPEETSTEFTVDDCARSVEKVKLDKRSNSESCILSLKFDGLLANGSVAAETRKKDEQNFTDVEEAACNESAEYHWSATERSGRRVRSWISRSTEELLGDDSLNCSEDVGEFGSLQNLACANSADCCGGDEDGCFYNKALDLSEEDVNGNTESHNRSLHFETERQENGNRFYDSFDSSYVVTMYV